MSNEKPGVSHGTPASPDELLKSGPDAGIELSESDLETVSGGQGGAKTSPAFVKLETWK